MQDILNQKQHITISKEGAIFTNTEWGNPKRIEVNEVGETIEMLYKQTSIYKQERIFKIVYSCVDGRWNKSAPIFGKIFPAQSEYFEFSN